MEVILAAQEGRLGHFPSYEQALSEIERGRKLSCWMWYIFPSLKAVRQHRMPSMLLQDFEEAQSYLRHDVLGPRLVAITRMANFHLRRGVEPNRLFGFIDAVKFHETCTVFAVAAVANESSESVFVEGLRLLGSQLNEQAVKGLKDQRALVQRVEELLVDHDDLPSEANKEKKAWLDEFKGKRRRNRR